MEETITENRVIESTADTNQGMTCEDSVNGETERKNITENTEGNKIRTVKFGVRHENKKKTHFCLFQG